MRYAGVSQSTVAVVLAALVVTACDLSTRVVAPRIELRVSPDLVIGGAEEGAESFSRINDIAVDAWGRIVLADVVEGQIRVFDSTGAFVRALGRRGRGPGEFNEPKGIRIRDDGGVTIYDPLQRRLSVFDSAGTVVDTHIIPISSWSYKWDGGMDSLGRLVDYQSTARADTGFDHHIRIRDLAKGQDTLLPYPTCGIANEAEFEHEFGIFGVPFGAGRVTTIDARRAGTWCASSARATTYFVPFGQLTPTDSFVSIATPERVAADERAAGIANLKRQVPNLAATGFDIDMIPDVKPMVQAFVSDERGRLWVELHDSAGTAYHVFSASGEWIARVRTTTNTGRGQQFRVRGNHLYAVTKDSLDVPLLVRFTVDLPN